MRKVYIVMQWGYEIHSVHSNRRQAEAVASELSSYSWKVRVVEKRLNDYRV